MQPPIIVQPSLDVRFCLRIFGPYRYDLAFLILKLNWLGVRSRVQGEESQIRDE